MRTAGALILSIILGLGLSQAMAKSKKALKASSSQELAAPRDHLSRDITFGDSSVYGKYQFANEATVTVENEKKLDDLLGVRTHFKDRLRLETMRH